MSDDAPLARDSGRVSSPKRTWHPPRLIELPKLTALTLASFIGGGGGTGGGGSTVFGLLLALVALAGCTTDPTAAPGAEGHTVAQQISCYATVATGVIDCAGPRSAAPEIVGGQGRLVALRSSNVAYDGSAIFQADVRIQNLAAQTLGGTGQGVDVFFESGPTVTGGTGVVTVDNPSGNGTFTHSGQDYFHYSDSIPSTVTSSAVTWKWDVPPTVTSFVFTVELSTSFMDEGGVLLWSDLPEFNNDTLSDIAVNSGSDAMVVGRFGLAYRKVGAAWSQVSNEHFATWVGIAAIGGGRYVAATTYDVYLFDGKVWKLLHHVDFGFGGGIGITSMSASSDADIVVTGQDEIAWWGDGGDSNDVALASGSGPWAHAATFSGGAAWIVSSTSGAYRQGSYNSATTSGGSASAITALTATFADQPVAGKYNGSSGFVQLPLTSTSLGPSLSNTTVDALAYADGGVGASLWRTTRDNSTLVTTLASWDGAWTDRATPPAQVKRMVNDSAGGLYLLSDDGLRRWNGSAVVDEFVGPSGSFPTAISGTATAAFVGMNNGDLRRYDGSTWSSATPGGFFQVAKVRAFSGTSAVALDTAAQFSIFDGANWSVPQTYAGARDVWGSDATHMVMVLYSSSGGGLSFVRHGDPFGTFTINTNPAGLNSPLNAAWGTSDTDFWVAGNGGVVLYYNGSSYTSEAPGTGEDLVAMDGTSNSDVWVAGTNGYVAHWDGASWTSCSMGSATITTIAVPRPGVVYVGTGAAIDTITAALCRYMGAYVPAGIGAVTVMDGPSASSLWVIAGKRVYWGHR